MSMALISETVSLPRENSPIKLHFKLLVKTLTGVQLNIDQILCHVPLGHW